MHNVFDNNNVLWTEHEQRALRNSYCRMNPPLLSQGGGGDGARFELKLFADSMMLALGVN